MYCFIIKNVLQNKDAKNSIKEVLNMIKVNNYKIRKRSNIYNNLLYFYDYYKPL